MQLDELTTCIDDGTIDTVVVAFTDHYGRLLGKRLDARFFMDHIEEGTHACDYLLTVDMEMEPVPGYESAGWEATSSLLAGTSRTTTCCKALGWKTSWVPHGGCWLRRASRWRAPRGRRRLVSTS